MRLIQQGVPLGDQDAPVSVRLNPSNVLFHGLDRWMSPFWPQFQTWTTCTRFPSFASFQICLSILSLETKDGHARPPKSRTGSFCLSTPLSMRWSRSCMSESWLWVRFALTRVRSGASNLLSVTWSTSRQLWVTLGIWWLMPFLSQAWSLSWLSSWRTATQVSPSAESYSLAQSRFCGCAWFLS